MSDTACHYKNFYMHIVLFLYWLPVLPISCCVYTVEPCNLLSVFLVSLWWGKDNKRSGGHVGTDQKSSGSHVMTCSTHSTYQEIVSWSSNQSLDDPTPSWGSHYAHGKLVLKIWYAHGPHQVMCLGNGLVMSHGSCCHEILFFSNICSLLI